MAETVLNRIISSKLKRVAIPGQVTTDMVESKNEDTLDVVWGGLRKLLTDSGYEYLDGVPMEGTLEFSKNGYKISIVLEEDFLGPVATD